MGLNQEQGKSVYCEGNLAKREISPLYDAAREMITRVSRRGDIVLDLGCACLLASKILKENGYNVIGLDLDPDALAIAQKRGTAIPLVCADLTSFPMGGNERVRAVLLLDVLEHLTREGIKGLLGELAEKFGCPLVVSMPIISPFSFPCLKERLRMWQHGGDRPMTGLFDRTHMVLTDRKGHRQIFEDVGYSVEAEHVSSWRGVTGTWETVRPVAVPSVLRWKAKQLIDVVIPAVLYPFDRFAREEVYKTIEGVQALYLLKPKCQF